MTLFYSSGIYIGSWNFILSNGLYALFSSIGGIIVFRILFSGHYGLYFLTHLHLLLNYTLIFVDLRLQLGTDYLFLLFPLLQFGWLLASLKIIKWKKLYKHAKVKISELYKSACSVFIINSIPVLILQMDKALVNNYFQLEIANAYSYAWMLTAPVFYIGNIFEKSVYTEVHGNPFIIIKKSFLYNGIFVLAYLGITLFLISNNLSLIPGIINYYLFKKILVIALPLYSLYAIIHFPLNAFLFKYLNPILRSRIGIWTGAVIIIYFLLLSIMMNNLVTDCLLLLIFNTFFLFMPLIIKTVLIIRYFLKGENGIIQKGSGAYPNILSAK